MSESQEDRSGRTGLHPIGVVSKRTGISLHVLRAWERRYGVVDPERTAGGQRLYSDADIRRLRLLRQVTEAGRNISQVATLPDEELSSLAAQDLVETPAAAERAAPVSPADYVQACLEAAERMDGEDVHGTLMRAVVRLRAAEFATSVVHPLLLEVGQRWHDGKLAPTQEHVVSLAVRRVLMWLLDAYEPARGAPLAVITTIAGEQHEFGAMLVSVIALEEGWRVSYLGPSLPAEEIALGASLVRASLVAVSAVASESGASDVTAEIRTLVSKLGSVPVLAGGAKAYTQRAAIRAAGATAVGTLDEAREVLRMQREIRANGTSRT